MIIVKLIGGLGNQMFQYAIGRYLSAKNQTILKLDLTELLDRRVHENFTFRNYELGEFNIQAELATVEETRPFHGGKSLFDRALSYINHKTGTPLIRENGQKFQDSVLNVGPNAYLSGYWQSENYFINSADLIRNDFTLKREILEKMERSDIFKKMNESISHSNAVAIHFRRGDYIHNPVTNKFHGVCSEEYYYTAINYINSKIEEPHYFVFSDEPEWLESNFKCDRPFTILKNNPGYFDLYLMSLCKHNIIANSSFSWWGAWLNKHPEKIVIAPLQWFNDPILNKDTIDLIPKNWIRI